MSVKEELEIDQFRQDGLRFLTLCVDVTLYWTGSVFEHKQQILELFDQSMKICGEDLRFYRTETMRRYREIDPSTFDLLPFWLSNAHASRDLYIFRMNGSSCPEEAPDTAFVFQAVERKKRGAVRLVLPSAFVERSPELLSNLARQLAPNFRFASGHAGYSFNWSDDLELEFQARRELFRLGMRHPGVDIPSITTTLFVILDGMKGVNWLTFIGNEQLARLGSLELLIQSLGEVVKVDHLPHGVMFQAGPAPQIGDVNRHERLPAYRTVAYALSRIRAPDHPPFILSGKLPDENATETWLGRFEGQ